MDFNFKATDVVKHSAAHVLAAAVKRIYPNAKIGVGPVTQDGYFYDIELEQEITEQDFPLIEKNMNQIIQENVPFQQVIMGKEAGYNMLLQLGEVFKAELLQKVPDQEVSFYKLGEEFVDLCRGPHVKTTGEVGIVKLLSVDKVHWNNDPSRPQMHRLKGVVFQNVVEYNDFESAMKKRDTKDFKKVAKRLGITITTKRDGHNQLSARGTVVGKRIKRYFLSELQSFKPIPVAPAKQEKDYGQFILDQAVEHALFHAQQKQQSYRDLPLSIYTDIMVEHEDLQTQDLFFHSFVDQTQQLVSSNDLVEKVIDGMRFITQDDFHVEIVCTDLDHPVVQALSSLLQKRIISHNKILSSSVGERIVVVYKSTDSTGQTWTLGTVYISPQTPLLFTSPANTRMHTSSLAIYLPIGDIIRYLISEYELAIPFALHPLQFRCIPIDTQHHEYAREVTAFLTREQFSGDVDCTAKSFNHKIRNAELLFIPFIFIVGQKEQMNEAVSVRHKDAEVGLVGLQSLKQFIFEHRE